MVLAILGWILSNFLIIAYWLCYLLEAYFLYWILGRIINAGSNLIDRADDKHIKGIASLSLRHACTPLMNDPLRYNPHS